MIKIYYAESLEAKPFTSDAEKILLPDRYSRYTKLKQEKDKLDCLAVGMLTNCCLEDPSELYKDENGCPRLKNGGYISISHSGGKSAIAICDRPIGLDLQDHTKRDYMAIAKIVFCDTEKEYLKNSSDTEEAFFKLWCLKESYMKAKGMGFLIPPKSFSFDISGDTPLLCSEDNEDWCFHYFKIEDLSAAVCTLSDEEISIKKISLT